MSFIQKLIPPQQWLVPVIILCGTILGLGFVILRLSNAASYLGDDPRTCINCHVMTPQYITWQHSSHREVATCRPAKVRDAVQHAAPDFDHRQAGAHDEAGETTMA